MEKIRQIKMRQNYVLIINIFKHLIRIWQLEGNIFECQLVLMVNFVSNFIVKIPRALYYLSYRRSFTQSTEYMKKQIGINTNPNVSCNLNAVSRWPYYTRIPLQLGYASIVTLACTYPHMPRFWILKNKESIRGL